MATAIEYLKAAASQLQLSSPLGRWAQKVSTLLDAGVAAPQFSFAKSVGTQSTIGSGTNLSLQGVGESRGINYNGTSWILTPGKTYRLTMLGRFVNFSDAANGELRIKWVDDSGTPLLSLVDSGEGVFNPMGFTGQANSSSAGTEMVYKVPAAGGVQSVVKLRCTASTGTADMASGDVTVMVQEIPGS